MRVMSKQSPRSAAEIMSLAIQYFNGTFGLEMSEHIPDCCAEFKNDLGYVTIQIYPQSGRNEIIMTSQEWEYQLMDFLKAI